MGDSRTRAEDRAAELAEAEENQRQLHAHSEAPSLSRVRQEQAKMDIGPAQPAVDGSEFPLTQLLGKDGPFNGDDDGPALELKCGPVCLKRGFVDIYDPEDAQEPLRLTPSEAKEVWEALTVLIREEIIQ